MEKKILAKVGQKEITNLDVQGAIQGLDPFQAQQFQTEEGQKYVLDDLINQELLYMYAKDNKIDQDEEFRNEMKRVEENVLKQYVINKILTSVKLTEEEKKAFFEAQKQSFSKPETASAKHILVDSEEKANDILGKINAGDLSFEDAAKELKVGSYTTTPVKTEFGYHIILKTAQKDKPALKEVKDDIISDLTDEKLKDDSTLEVTALVELRKKHKVEIQDKDIKKLYEAYVEKNTK